MAGHLGPATPFGKENTDSVKIRSPCRAGCCPQGRNGLSWSCSGSCTRRELEEGKLWGTPVLVDAGLCPPQAGVKLLGVKLLQLGGVPIFATSWVEQCVFWLKDSTLGDRQTDPDSPCEHQKLMTHMAGLRCPGLPGRLEVLQVTQWGLQVQEGLADCPPGLLLVLHVGKGEKGCVFVYRSLYEQDLKKRG